MLFSGNFKKLEWLKKGLNVSYHSLSLKNLRCNQNIDQKGRFSWDKLWGKEEVTVTPHLSYPLSGKQVWNRLTVWKRCRMVMFQTYLLKAKDTNGWNWFRTIGGIVVTAPVNAGFGIPAFTGVMTIDLAVLTEGVKNGRRIARWISNFFVRWRKRSGRASQSLMEKALCVYRLRWS